MTLSEGAGRRCTQTSSGPARGSRSKRASIQTVHLAVPLAPGVRLPAAVIVTVGASSYFAGNHTYILDALGLADPLTARLETPLFTGLLPYPGHEKALPPPWIIARMVAPGVHVDPTDLPENTLFVLIPPTTGAALDAQVAWARKALQCPPIRRLTRDTSGRLTVGRFLHNIVDSFANTRLRIPPDPETAYRKLCGSSRSAPERPGEPQPPAPMAPDPRRVRVV